MKSIKISIIILVTIIIFEIDCQLLPSVKPRPVFDIQTMFNANKVLISRNASLNTSIYTLLL